MDTTQITTHAVSSSRQPRDHGIQRRAYLDTYARKRAGIAEPALPIQEQVAVVQPQQPQQHLPIAQVVKPVVIAVPVTQVIDQSPVVIESQPPVVGQAFDFVAAQTQQTSAKTSSTSDTEDTHPHKSYLDTLTKRHVAAVAQAPAAIETVTETELTPSTANLLEDPAQEARIEANLRALYEDTSLTSQITNNRQSASASHVRTIVGSAFACGIIAVGMFTFMGRYSSQPVVAQPIGSPVIEVDSSNLQQPKGAPTNTTNNSFVQSDPAYPVNLMISSIGVNAPVQSLGTTSDGLIAVPQSYGVVGWYNKGAIPGKPGPAVLVGHYTGGNGGVFDKLKDLKVGDLITTTNGKGESVTFKVSATNEYDKDNVPMADLLKSSSDSRLQIITCSGKWQSKNYNKRLVVTAEIAK